MAYRSNIVNRISTWSGIFGLNTVRIQTIPNQILFTLCLVTLVCTQPAKRPEKDWIDLPLSEWPELVLTNRIIFSDTAYNDIACAFLADTGRDTVGVTAKHLFLLFQKHQGLSVIHLGEQFQSWNLRSVMDSSIVIPVDRVININENEPIGDFNEMKDRDWLVFDLANPDTDAYPLKIRFTPLRKNERVLLVGVRQDHSGINERVVSRLQCFTRAGTYYYMKAVESSPPPEGTSGAPVLDMNGYLVGISSGAVGNLAVVGGVDYLRHLFDKYHIDYADPTEA